MRLQQLEISQQLSTESFGQKSSTCYKNYPKLFLTSPTKTTTRTTLSARFGIHFQFLIFIRILDQFYRTLNILRTIRVITIYLACCETKIMSRAWLLWEMWHVSRPVRTHIAGVEQQSRHVIKSARRSYSNHLETTN